MKRRQKVIISSSVPHASNVKEKTKTSGGILHQKEAILGPFFGPFSNRNTKQENTLTPRNANKEINAMYGFVLDGQLCNFARGSSGSECDPFTCGGRRSPFGIWDHRFGAEGVVAGPFEAWNDELLGGGEGLGRDDSRRVERWHVGGWEDESLSLWATVLDDEFVDEDYDNDDDHDENFKISQ